MDLCIFVVKPQSLHCMFKTKEVGADLDCWPVFYDLQ